MIFLRHPAPDIAPGICYGQTDMGIADEGHDQIKQALIQTPKITRIVSSPAKRCRALAKPLAARDDLTLHYDERLWEMNMGDWEGIAWKDIDPAISGAWLKDAQNNPTPNGECFLDVQQRVNNCITEILADNNFDQNTTAIICHASPIRATQMAWEGLSFKEAFSQAPAYASPIHIHPDFG